MRHTVKRRPIDEEKVKKKGRKIKYTNCARDTVEASSFAHISLASMFKERRE